MRIGLVGPAERDGQAFRLALQFLLSDAEAEQVVYLGERAFAVAALDAWSGELERALGEGGFAGRAAALAIDGSASALDALLEADALRASLARVAVLPDAPARAVELVEDRVVLLVHDKSVLDEEDIANAHLVVYGRADASELRRFGRRTFFTPGPVAAGHVGLLESDDESVTLALYDLEGVPLWRESLAMGGVKVTVAR